jgi:diadenosine tetraphosphate (Ap4A) HIT family hydrolase
MFYKTFIKNITKCPFCNLEDNEILKENKHARLILAKAPYTKDHLLVVPKRHAITLKELTKQEKESVDSLVNLAMTKIQKQYHDASILYIEGNMKKIGKSIEHIHYHIIPKLIIGAINIDLRKRKVLFGKEYLTAVKNIKKII